MPGGKNVGKNIAEYAKKHPGASRAQKIAVGLSEARAAGAKIPKPPKRKPKKGGGY